MIPLLSKGNLVAILRNEEIASTLMIAKDLTITSDKAVTISANSVCSVFWANVSKL